MSKKNHREILIVLLFRDAQFAKTFGPSLWAAMKELELFWREAYPERAFRQHFLAPLVPRAVTRELKDENWKRVNDAVQSEAFWLEARGRYKRCLDQEKLTRQVRGLLDAPVNLMLLITDQEITPPPEWRYILASGVRNG